MSFLKKACAGIMPARAAVDESIAGCSESRPVLEIKNLTKAYHAGPLQVPVLKGINFSVDVGESSGNGNE